MTSTPWKRIFVAIWRPSVTDPAAVGPDLSRTAQPAVEDVKNALQIIEPWERLGIAMGVQLEARLNGIENALTHNTGGDWNGIGFIESVARARDLLDVVRAPSPHTQEPR